jgi:hypothetical protein
MLLTASSNIVQGLRQDDYLKENRHTGPSSASSLDVVPRRRSLDVS